MFHGQNYTRHRLTQPQRTMNKTIGILLQALLAGVCLYYVLSNLDVGRLGTALAGIPLWLSWGALIWAAANQVFAGQRLRSLLPRLPLRQAFQAEAMAAGVSNIFPAKLGEVAKVIYLSRRLPDGMCEAMDAVFWCRFFDVNILMLLGLAAGTQLSLLPVVYSLAFVMGGVWFGLLLFRFWPGLTPLALRLIPAVAALAALRQLIAQVPQRLSLGFVVGLGLRTALLWGMEILLHGVVLSVLFSGGPSFSQILTVTSAGLLGLVAPGVPGSVGVYEAAIVFTLGAYGYDKDTALAAAIFLHLAQAFLCTTIGLWVFFCEGLSLGSLLRGKQTQPAPPSTQPQSPHP